MVVLTDAWIQPHRHVWEIVDARVIWRQGMGRQFAPSTRSLLTTNRRP
jgi:hypothetical protein